MHAVITAGGRVDGDFAHAIGTPVKALAKVGGVTMLSKAIAAARAAGAQRIAVVGGDEVREAVAESVDDFIPESFGGGRDGADNVHRALTFFGDAPLLYLTSDMPYVDGRFVSEFLDRAAAEAVSMPLADARTYEMRFPGAADHVTAIAHERVANASVFFIPRGAAPVIDGVAQRLFAARKSASRMALLLGPALLLKFALKRLTIADVERRAAHLLGLSVRAVRDCAPELCFDVDTFEDYRYACGSA